MTTFRELVETRRRPIVTAEFPSIDGGTLDDLFASNRTVIEKNGVTNGFQCLCLCEDRHSDDQSKGKQKPDHISTQEQFKLRTFNHTAHRASAVPQDCCRQISA